MERAEFIPIAATIQKRWWAFPIPPGALDQYVVDLADLDAGSVSAAVDALAAVDERERPPTAGQIRMKVAKLEFGVPEWDEVKAQLVQRKQHLDVHDPPEWKCPYDECDGSGFKLDVRPRHVVALRKGEVTSYEVDDQTHTDCRCRPERTAARKLTSMLHPLVAEFIAERRVTWSEVARISSVIDTQLEAQMRTKWEAFSARIVESRVLAAIDAPAGMGRIEEARTDDADRRGLRTMDAARLLGPGDTDAAAA